MSNNPHTVCTLDVVSAVQKHGSAEAWQRRSMAYLELQVVIALADDMEQSLASKAQGDRGHDALPGVKLEAGVLPLTPHVHQVVGLRGVVIQVQGHFGLIDTAVLGAEHDFHCAFHVLQPLYLNSENEHDFPFCSHCTSTVRVNMTFIMHFAFCSHGTSTVRVNTTFIMHSAFCSHCTSMVEATADIQGTRVCYKLQKDCSMDDPGYGQNSCMKADG